MRAAEEQHSAIEDVARAVADVRTDAARAAEDALAVAAGAEDSQRLTSEGGEAVTAMVTRMREAGGRVETVAADVRGLAEHVRRAGEITVAVRELAERSNLLALNASIEAAQRRRARPRLRRRRRRGPLAGRGVARGHGPH